MRKLASVQRIKSVSPIPGADRIERLEVLGWSLVSGKGNFLPGQLMIYLEVDSIPPDTPDYDFLWQPVPKEGVPVVKVPRPDNFKLRSRRFKGVLSQGLALPVSLLPPEVEPVEGLDVTELLQIRKWEMPTTPTSPREIEGLFPTHVFPKTDELRVQSVPEVLEELRGVECYMAVKLDGQSLTFAKYDEGGEVVHKVCTRNYALKDLEDNPHWMMARQLRVFDKMPVGFAVQGEYVGPGVQANRMGLQTKEFYAFQVYSITERRYLDYRDFLQFCDVAGIPTVPVEWVGPLDVTVEALLARAEGTYASGHPREGLVIRPTVERLSTVLGAYEGGPARASFKAINNQFLLKIGD